MAGDHELYGLLLDMAVRDRDEAALKKYLEMAAETAERCEHPLFQAVAARARGVSQRLAGNTDEAREHFEQAMAGFRQLDTRWQIGRTLVDLGELENHRGAKPDAARVSAMLDGR
jgi:hypothetical protein